MADEPTQGAANWHAVPRKLVGADAPPTQLFLRVRGRYALYYSPNSMSWAEALQRLQDKPVDTFWVRDDQFAAFQQHVAKRLQDVAADQSLPAFERGQLVYHACYQALQESFTDLRDPVAFQRAAEISREAVSALADHPEILPGIGVLMGYHYDTFSHSVQVASMSVTLAQRLDFTSREELISLGLGAMFHDIGKVRVPLGVINKPGPLSPPEWAVMQKHPGWGHALLGQFDAAGIAIEPVLQHHERFHGGGYPHGRQGDEIALSARVTKVADVFHALTSRRSYREPLDAYGAVSLMRTQMLRHFDPHVLDEFILLLGTIAKPDTQPDESVA